MLGIGRRSWRDEADAALVAREDAVRNVQGFLVADPNGFNVSRLAFEHGVCHGEQESRCEGQEAG